MRHRCYTLRIPTQRRRHAITETPPVQEALDRLRAQIGEDNVKLPELVILGAESKLAQVRAEDDARRERRHRLAARVRARTLELDPDAADEVRRSGWAR